jgi:DNA (cytosine-5)-methyltransferase 1
MTEPLVVVDQYCGAGGTSTGVINAALDLGMSIDLIGVNHSPEAIATHTANYPWARHFCQDLTKIDPHEAVPGGWVDLLVSSPECTHFSQARGGKPILDQKRTGGWEVIKWCRELDVQCVLVENVPEYTTWGPVVNGKLAPRGKGAEFQKWVAAFWSLGYTVEWRFLNAADFGDATTRTRFFLQARKDGWAIEWPAPTHARDPRKLGPLGAQLAPWRAAREIIDWSLAGKSILDRKVPLSINTRRRIARGFAQFGGPLAPLYIRLLDLPEGAPMQASELREELHEPFLIGQRDSWDGRQVVPGRARSVEREPIPCVSSIARIGLAQGAAEPFTFANRLNNRPRDLDEPVAPATSGHGGGIAHVEPTAAPFVLARQSNPIPKSPDDPIGALTDRPPYLVESSAAPFVLSQASGGEPRPVELPIPTIATAGFVRLFEPHVSAYYGNGGPESLERPLSSATTRQRHGLVDPQIVPYGPRAEARSVELPAPTVMTSDRLALAQPIIDRAYGRSSPASPDAPLSAISGTNHHALVEPSALIATFGERPGQAPRAHAVDQPLPTINATRTPQLAQGVIAQLGQTGGNGKYVRSTDEPLSVVQTKASHALAQPMIAPFYGDSHGVPRRPHSIDEPLRTIRSEPTFGLADPTLDVEIPEGVDRRRLVYIDGVLHVLDILFRMLANHELAGAMSFPPEYHFAGTRSQVCKQIGNAVACRIAKALATSMLYRRPAAEAVA